MYLGTYTDITILLERLDDTTKDVPDAVKMLACFISRAIVDESLYPLYLTEANLITEGQLLATRCLQKCHYLINLKFAAQRLQRVFCVFLLKLVSLSVLYVIVNVLVEKIYSPSLLTLLLLY